MPSLSEVLADPAKRKRVIDDGVAVVEAEVADKSGLSGMAIKAAFGMVQKIKPGFVGGALNHLMPDLRFRSIPSGRTARKVARNPVAIL